jgi:hypothetical protein
MAELPPDDDFDPSLEHVRPKKSSLLSTLARRLAGRFEREAGRDPGRAAGLGESSGPGEAARLSYFATYRPRLSPPVAPPAAIPAEEAAFLASFPTVERPTTTEEMAWAESMPEAPGSGPSREEAVWWFMRLHPRWREVMTGDLSERFDANPRDEGVLREIEGHYARIQGKLRAWWNSLPASQRNSLRTRFGAILRAKGQPVTEQDIMAMAHAEMGR